ncbi:MAG: hypothetical protein ACRDY1_05860 [Acidimicrobiales bacterium]
MNFVVMLLGEVRVQDGAGEVPANVDELVESHLDDVMDELDNLGTVDPSIELDLTKTHPQVTFQVLVTAANPLGAASQASGLLRTAIHAANGATPDWPGPQDERWYVRLLSMRSELLESTDTEDAEAEADAELEDVPELIKT